MVHNIITIITIFMGTIEELKITYPNGLSDEELHANDDLLLVTAFQHKNINLIKWLHNHSILINSPFHDKIIVELIAECPHLLDKLLKIFTDDKIIQLLYEHSCRIGVVNIVDYLYYKDSQRCKLNAYDFSVACSKGHIDIVKWFIETFPDKNKLIHYNNDISLRWACQGGYLDIVQLIVNTSKDKKMNSINFSLQNDVLLRVACQKGHTCVVDYLLSCYKITSIYVNNAFINACSSGHLDIAKKIYTYGVDLNRIMSDNEQHVIDIRTLPISMYNIDKITLRSCDMYTCFDEAIISTYNNNHFDIFIWLTTLYDIKLSRYRICPNILLYKICEVGLTEGIDFLIEHCKENQLIFSVKNFIDGYPEDTAFLNAIKSGNLEVVIKIYNLGIITQNPVNITDNCVIIDNNQTNVYVNANNIPISTRIFYEACVRNYNHIVIWLFDICKSLG